MTRRHWTEADFVVTETAPAYDGSATVNRYGYCAKCKADMQSFGGNGKLGPILHYNSHKRAKRVAALLAVLALTACGHSPTEPEPEPCPVQWQTTALRNVAGDSVGTWELATGVCPPAGSVTP